MMSRSEHDLMQELCWGLEEVMLLVRLQIRKRVEHHSQGAMICEESSTLPLDY